MFILIAPKMRPVARWKWHVFAIRIPGTPYRKRTNQFLQTDDKAAAAACEESLTKNFTSNNG
jgi:hypothetical protein